MLRKGIKIKAATVLFAWLVTFAHGVIPHIHIQEGHDDCTVLIHTISGESIKCTDETLFSEKTDDLKVCHYSTFLFKQYDPDLSAITNLKDTKIFPVLISDIIPLRSTENCLYEPYFGSSALRAPPSV